MMILEGDIWGALMITIIDNCITHKKEDLLRQIMATAT
jgi:hypothetical protein